MKRLTTALGDFFTKNGFANAWLAGILVMAAVLLGSHFWRSGDGPEPQAKPQAQQPAGLPGSVKEWRARVEGRMNKIEAMRALVKDGGLPEPAALAKIWEVDQGVIDHFLSVLGYPKSRDQDWVERLSHMLNGHDTMMSNLNELVHVDLRDRAGSQGVCEKARQAAIKGDLAGASQFLLQAENQELARAEEKGADQAAPKMAAARIRAVRAWVPRVEDRFNESMDLYRHAAELVMDQDLDYFAFLLKEANRIVHFELKQDYLGGIKFYRQVLSGNIPARPPGRLGQAAAHGGGMSIFTWGEDKPGPAGADYLQEAVAAFREAAGDDVRAAAPLVWGNARSLLANALLALSLRQPGTKGLDEAARAMRDSALIWTREWAPAVWPLIQTHLAEILLNLGEREPWDHAAAGGGGGVPGGFVGLSIPGFQAMEGLPLLPGQGAYGSSASGKPAGAGAKWRRGPLGMNAPWRHTPAPRTTLNRPGQDVSWAVPSAYWVGPMLGCST